MSIEQKIAKIKNHYDSVSNSDLQKEMKLYSKKQGQEVKKMASKKIFDWGNLDDNDRSSLKSVFYKFTGWTFIVLGFQKIVGDKTNAEIVGWRPEWNKNLFVQVMMNRKGIPMYLMGTMVLLPSLMFHLSRIGMKYYQVDQAIKDEEAEKKFLAGETKPLN